MQEGLLIPLTLFTAIAVVLYQFIKTRHAERMAIIEKGVSDEQLSYLLRAKKRTSSNDLSIKIGAISIGVGLAILLGNITAPHDMVEEIVTGLVFLFPGIALLLSYKYLLQNSDKGEDVS